MRRTRVVLAVLAIILPAQAGSLTFGAVTIGAAIANACCPVRPCNGSWLPQPVPGTDPLLAVSAVSISDAWAVGGGTGGAGHRALLEHFAGETAGWSIVFRGSGAVNNEFFGVDALSASDVWAVGYKDNSAGTAKTYVLHYGGSTFSEIASPNATGNNYLEAVSFDSPSDGWAVGYHNTNGADTPLVERWDGQTWSVVGTPSSIDNGRLLSVVASAPNDVWAVGFFRSSPTGSTQTLTEHWNGSQWTVVNSPSTGASRLLSVTADSGGDVWASGFQTSGGTKTLVEYWDGSAWSVQATPNPGNNPVLEGISATGGHSAWAVGYYVDDQNRDVVLIEHWDGSVWSRAAAPSPGTTSYLDSVSAVASTQVWTVGFRLHNTTRRALTERLC